MATTHRNATASTRIERTAEGYRVVYDTPPGGFTADEYDALQVAIAVAQRRIAELSQAIAAPLATVAPLATAAQLDPLTLQHDRMAAPC